MNRIKIIYNDFCFYGIWGAISSILNRLGIISTEKLYEIRVKTHYCKLAPSEYQLQLKKWLKVINQDMDIENPSTYNEKIQWLKTNDYSELKSKLSDKYVVREWVKDRIGSEYLIPLVGVWNSVEEIEFKSLPDAFCIKANHGSNMNLIVKDKNAIDFELTKKKIKWWNKVNFGWEGFELQYVNIPMKYIAEEYIEQMDGNLFEYKIHCFNGYPKIIQVIGYRDNESHTASEAFYDTNWFRNDNMYHTYQQAKNGFDKPDNLCELLTIASKLSEGFKYVRVDLYDLDGSIKFGEMTFTPANGLGNWQDEKIAKMVGEWIVI